MRRTSLGLALAGLVACTAEGGPSGTGITNTVKIDPTTVWTTIDGNVSRLRSGSGSRSLSGISISLGKNGTGDTTDDHGLFLVQGPIGGQALIEISRAGESWVAHLPLEVPRGATIVLEDLEIDPDLGTAEAMMTVIAFESVVTNVLCEQNAFAAASRHDPKGARFGVRLPPATSDPDGPSCFQLRAGQAIDVSGVVLVDGTIQASEIAVPEAPLSPSAPETEAPDPDAPSAEAPSAEADTDATRRSGRASFAPPPTPGVPTPIPSPAAAP